MKNIILAGALGTLCFLASCSTGGQNENTEPVAGKDTIQAPQGRVFFENLSEGDTVVSPVKVAFGLEGMEIRPAGDMTEGTGHHHLIINGSFIKEGVVIPVDEKHIHFGAGQTSTEVELSPGNYNLTMQFADGMHQSYGKPLSTSINIVVAADSLAQ